MLCRLGLGARGTRNKVHGHLLTLEAVTTRMFAMPPTSSSSSPPPTPPARGSSFWFGDFLGLVSSIMDAENRGLGSFGGERKRLVRTDDSLCMRWLGDSSSDCALPWPLAWQKSRLAKRALLLTIDVNSSEMATTTTASSTMTNLTAKRPSILAAGTPARATFLLLAAGAASAPSPRACPAAGVLPMETEESRYMY